jgi:hypothetical protein
MKVRIRAQKPLLWILVRLVGSTSVPLLVRRLAPNVSIRHADLLHHQCVPTIFLGSGSVVLKCTILATTIMWTTS